MTSVVSRMPAVAFLANFLVVSTHLRKSQFLMSSLVITKSKASFEGFLKALTNLA